MALFDKLKQAAGQLADGASRQAELLRLQTQLASVENEMDRNFAQIGRRARELFRKRQLFDADIEVLVKRIDDSEAQLQELRGRVQELQRRVADVPSSDATPPPATEPPSPPEAQPSPAPTQASPPEPQDAPRSHEPPPSPAALCPHCGHGVRDDARFCEDCGGKLGGD